VGLHCSCSVGACVGPWAAVGGSILAGKNLSPTPAPHPSPLTRAPPAHGREGKCSAGALGIVIDAEKCLVENRERIGDGGCDADSEYNTPECGYL
jgi:hypothetical protein